MVSLPRRKTFLIVRAIIVACFFALFFSLPLTWLDHSQSQVTIAHAQDCDPYSDPDCPPPDQGPQCDYEQWSDEYDCSGGYRCYNDYFQDPSTDCQPQAKSPRYHCDRDSACDDAPQGCTAGEVNRSDIGCQGDQYCYDVTIQDASCDQEQRTECVSDTSCQDQGGGNGGGGGPSCSGGQVDDGNGSCVCPNGTSWDGSQCTGSGGGTPAQCTYQEQNVNGTCNGTDWCYQTHTQYEDCSENTTDWICSYYAGCDTGGGGGGQTCSYSQDYVNGQCSGDQYCQQVKTTNEDCSESLSDWQCFPDTSCQDQGGGNGGGGGQTCSAYDDRRLRSYCDNSGNLCTDYESRSDSCDTTSRTDCQPDTSCQDQGGGNGGGGGPSCSGGQVDDGNGSCVCPNGTSWDGSQCTGSGGGGGGGGGQQQSCSETQVQTNGHCDGDQWCVDIQNRDTSCNWSDGGQNCQFDSSCQNQIQNPQTGGSQNTCEPSTNTSNSRCEGDQLCNDIYTIDASCNTNSDTKCDYSEGCAAQNSPQNTEPEPTAEPTQATCDLQPYSQEYGDCQTNNGQRCFNDYDVDQASCSYIPRTNSDGNVYHCDPDPSCPQPSAEEPSLEESPSPEVSPTVACTLQPTSKAYDCSHDQRCFNDFDVDQTTCTLVPKVNEDGNTFHCDPDPKCAGDVNKIPQEEIDAKLSVTPTPVPGWKPPSLADITNGAGALLGALGNGVDQLVYDVSPIEDCSQYGPPSDYTKENDPYGSQRHLAQACVDKANLANTFGSYFAEKNREAEAQANLPDTSIDCRIALADYMTRSSAGENPSWPADVCGAQKFSTRTPEQARDAAVAAATAAPASDDSEAQFKAGLKELGVDVNSDLAQANADCTAPADANQDVSAVLRKCQALDMAKQMGLDPNDYANWDSAQRDLYFGRVARSDFNLAKATGEIIGAPISSYENMRDAEGICQKTLGQACYVNKDNPSAYANISDADAANLTKAGKQVYGDSFDPASTDQVKAYADILARQQQVSKALSYSQGGYGGYSSLAADAVPTTDQQIAQSMGISVDELQNVKRTYGVWGGAANEIRTNSTAGVQYQQAQEQLQTDAAVGIVSNAFDPVPVLKAIGVGGKTAFVVSKSGFGKLVANLGEKEAEELAPRLAVAAGKAARGEVLDQAEKDVLVKGAEAAGTNADEFVGVFDQAAAPSDAQLVSAVQSNDIVVPLQAPALDQAVSAEGVDAAARQGLADAGDGTVAQASVVSAGEAPAPGVSAPEKPVVVIEPSSAAPVTPGGDNPITTLGDDIDAALHPAASVDHPDVAPQNPVVAAVVDSTPADVPVVELPTGPVLADPERVAADVAETTAKPGAVAERSVDSAEPVAVEPARVASVLDDADQGLAEQAAAERSSNPVVAAAQDAGDTAARLTDDAATTGDDLLKKATGQEPDLPAIGPKEEPKPIAEGQIAEATPLTGDDIVYHGEEPCPAGLAAELPLAFADGKKAVLAASTVVGPTGCKISIDGDNSNHGEDAQGAAKAGGIVADGISQGGNSKYASKAAVESAQRDMQSLPTRVQRMDAATQQNLRQQAEGVMQNANQAAASARPRGAGQGYGTTFQAAHIVTDAQGNHTAMIFGVADSPAYILKPDGTMTRVLTNPDLVARGDVIGADEVARRGLDERYVGALKQSLGTGQPLKLTPDHVQFVPLQKGDRVFLMSDGPEKVFPELSQKQAPTIGKILAQTKPGEGAESLMNGVRNVTGGRMPDDMSVAEILHPDFPTNGRAQQPAASAQARAAADQAQANAQKAAAEQAQAQAQAHARQAAASAAAGDYAGARASVENAFGQASLAERIAQANPNNAAARTAADAANKRANEGLSALTFEATRAKSNAEGAGLRVESRLNDARAGSPADARGAADQAVKARTAAQNAKDAADQLQELARGDPRFQAHADYARQEAAAADAAATQAEEKATQVSQVAADQRRAASQQANGSGQTNQGQQTGSQGSNTTGNGQAGNTSAGAAPKRPTNRPSYFTNPFLPDSLRDEVIVASDGTIRDVVNINPFDFMSTNPEYRVTYADGTTRIVHYNDLITDAERSAADARTAAASARSAGVGAGTTGSTRPAGSGAASGAVVDTPEMAAYRAAVKTQNELSDIFAMKYGRDPGSPLTPEDEALLRKYGFGPDILKLNDSDLYAKMHINDEEVRVAREHPNLTEAQRNLVLDSIDDPNAGKPAGGSSQAGAQQAAPGPQGQGSQAAPGTSGGAGSAGPSTSGRAASQVAPAPGVKPESSPRVNAYTKSKKVVDDLTTIDGIRSGHGPGITISDADEKLLAEYGFPTDPSKLNETEINRQLTAAKASLDRAKNNRDFVRELNVDNVNPTIVKQLKDVDPEIVAVTFRPESIDGQLSYTVTYKDGTTRTLTHDQNILVNAQKVVDERDAAVAAAAAKKAAEEVADKANQPVLDAMIGQDLYARLGVPRTASDREIKVAYARLIAKYHPDRNPGAVASDIARLLNESRDVLTSGDARTGRAAYDGGTYRPTMANTARENNVKRAQAAAAGSAPGGTTGRAGATGGSTGTGSTTGSAGQPGSSRTTNPGAGQTGSTGTGSTPGGTSAGPRTSAGGGSGGGQTPPGPNRATGNTSGGGQAPGNVGPVGPSAARPSTGGFGAQARGFVDNLRQGVTSTWNQGPEGKAAVILAGVSGVTGGGIIGCSVPTLWGSNPCNARLYQSAGKPSSTQPVAVVPTPVVKTPTGSAVATSQPGGVAATSTATSTSQLTSSAGGPVSPNASQGGPTSTATARGASATSTSTPANTPTAGSTATSQPVSPSQGGPSATSTSTTSTANSTATPYPTATIIPGYCSNFNPPTKSREFDCSNGERCYDDYELNPYNCKYVAHKNDNGAPFHCDPDPSCGEQLIGSRATRTIPGTPADQVPPPIPPVATAPINSTSTPTAGSTATSQPVSPSQGGPALATATPATPTYCSDYATTSYSQEYSCAKGLRCFNDYDLDSGTCTFVPRTNADGSWYHCDADASCAGEQPEVSPGAPATNSSPAQGTSSSTSPGTTTAGPASQPVQVIPASGTSAQVTANSQSQATSEQPGATVVSTAAGAVGAAIGQVIGGAPGAAVGQAGGEALAGVGQAIANGGIGAGVGQIVQAGVNIVNGVLGQAGLGSPNATSSATLNGNVTYDGPGCFNNHSVIMKIYKDGHEEYLKDYGVVPGECGNAKPATCGEQANFLQCGGTSGLDGKEPTHLFQVTPNYVCDTNIMQYNVVDLGAKDPCLSHPVKPASVENGGACIANDQCVPGSICSPMGVCAKGAQTYSLKIDRDKCDQSNLGGLGTACFDAATVGNYFGLPTSAASLYHHNISFTAVSYDEQTGVCQYQLVDFGKNDSCDLKQVPAKSRKIGENCSENKECDSGVCSIYPPVCVEQIVHDRITGSVKNPQDSCSEYQQGTFSCYPKKGNYYQHRVDIVVTQENLSCSYNIVDMGKGDCSGVTPSSTPTRP